MALAGKKAVIAGATGSVGRLMVQTCLGDPRVGQVAAVVRRPISADKAEELWGGGSVSEKLTQVQVDYPSLHVEDPKLKEAFQGADAFLTGLGLYSGNSTEDEMIQIEVKYNQTMAILAHEAGAKRGAYLSGQGVKQPTREGRALVKGQAEESLANVFSGSGEGHVSVRPGGIFDRPGEPVYGFLESMMSVWPFNGLKNTRFGISAPDIAKGMVQGALFDNKSLVEANTVWENESIKEAARRYEEYFESKS